MNADTTSRRDDHFYPIVAIGALAIALLSACAPAVMPRAATPHAAAAVPPVMTWTAPADTATDIAMASADAEQVGASIANFDR